MDWKNNRGQRWLIHIAELEAMLIPTNEPITKFIKSDHPLKVAEIGSGSGATTFEICKQIRSSGVVDGYDISPDLTQYAKSHPSPKNLRVRPSFFQVDAQSHKPPLQYDKLVSRFGVMFFENEEQAFSNLLTWLHPGADFCFLVWGRPKNNLWIYLVKDVFQRYTRLPESDPDAPGPFRYCDSKKFTSILNKSGFEDVQSSSLKLLLPVGGGLNAKNAASFALNAFSTFGDIFKGESQEIREHIAKDLAASYKAFENDLQQVNTPAEILVVTGKR